MYSRIPHSPRWSGHDIRREPSYRQGVLPPNYGGTAFHVHPTTGEIGTPDAAIGETLPRRPEDDTTPRFDDLPRVSRLTSVRQEPGDAPDQAVKGVVSTAPPTSGLLSLLDGRHFPFGHGIGYEEMLIIGLIFFLAKECDGEGDLKETLILLGLLLLGG